jgi:hypothetical protein
VQEETGVDGLLRHIGPAVAKDEPDGPLRNGPILAILFAWLSRILSSWS